MIVSFIIPVYKVEAYLRQCVESLTCQTYRDIEIILVDDGSPDGCPALCDQLAAEDFRIRVYHKPNGGLSDTRNYGLNQAQGEYVFFVDGDDFWLHNDDLQKLVALAEENPDAEFIGYNCKYYYPETNSYTPWVEYSDKLSIKTDKDTTTIALVESGTFPMSACLKMLKRKFLLDNDLFFVKGLIAEDIPWFINVLDKVHKCLFVNMYVYAYRQNVAGSLSNAINPATQQRSFNSLYHIFKTELNLVQCRSFSPEAKNALKSFLAYEYCILLTYPNLSSEIKRELRSYKDILNYTANPKTKKASLIYKLFGIRATEYVLKLYQKKRESKK